MAESATQNVTGPLTSAALFLVLTIDPGGEQQVRDTLAALASLRRAVAFRDPDPESLKAVAGIGSDAWDRLISSPRPAHLHPFARIKGPVHTAPTTPVISSCTFAPTAWTCATSWPTGSSRV